MDKVSVKINSKVNEIFAKINVIQKFKNQSDSPLELKIYVCKNDNLIFSSFNAKIGDSITCKSKVIKKEKAEIKYNDSIASGNAAIFVMEDPDDSRYLIINMGNIPPNEEVIFISEFLQYVEFSKYYEFELFRNLPIFKGKSEIYQNEDLKGTINIETKNKIIKIEKEILMKELKINEEKYLNEDKNNYLVYYEIQNLPQFSKYNKDNYIPSSKIYFELDLNEKTYEPIVYCQKSLLNENESNYIIHYTNKTKISNKDNLPMNQALFIFLIDQSGSMSGNNIKIASKGLKLFLQSLPPKSYYQIIGFGTTFKAYDEKPKEYTQENILQSINIIEDLKADLGGTDIYSPLKYVYDSYEIHDKINLPRNIFLLTDGAIDDKKKTLDLIYKNSSKYFIYSIGIGNYFDEDLIKNAGIIGKGGYNFCKDLEVSSVIVNEINKSISGFCSNITIKTSLDDKNMIKNTIPIIMRDNQNVNLNYIINDKEINNKINIEINYLENEEKIEKKYEVIPENLPVGEELSKLIINNYLNENNLEEEKETNMALKYQILRKNTSLFAEIELLNKVTEKIKEEILGNKEIKNQEEKRRMEEEKRRMEEEKRRRIEEEERGRRREKEESERRREEEEIRRMEEERRRRMEEERRRRMEEESERRMVEKGGNDNDRMRNNIDDLARRVIRGDFGNGPERRNRLGNLYRQIQDRVNEMLGISRRFNKNDNSLKNNMGNNMINNNMPIQNVNNSINCNNNESSSSKLNESPFNDIKNEDKIKKIDLNSKDDIMKIIDTLDFVNGFWDINEYTEIIKEKYKREYNLLKEKNKNINNKVAITILIIYFVNKEHPELLKELIMIIRKAKIFILNETKNTYENIVKDL